MTFCPSMSRYDWSALCRFRAGRLVGRTTSSPPACRSVSWKMPLDCAAGLYLGDPTAAAAGTRPLSPGCGSPRRDCPGWNSSPSMPPHPAATGPQRNRPQRRVGESGPRTPRRDNRAKCLSSHGPGTLGHSGLDLSSPMFAPCLLGCPGTPRHHPVSAAGRRCGQLNRMQLPARDSIP
jgi:hypothetical protein